MTNKNSTLYQYEACPFCWKVRALMAYKGIPYEKVESNQIMRHLDERYPDKPVFATTDEAKGKEKQWMDWCDKFLVRALPPVIYKSFGEAVGAFDYITQCGNFSWVQQRVIKYAGAFVMTMVAKKSAKAQGIADPKLHLKKLLTELSEGLNGNAFLGESKPNAADISAFGVLKAIETLPAFQAVEANQKVADWYRNLAKLVLCNKSLDSNF